MIDFTATRSPKPIYHQSIQGYTLIELMIAMVLGLLITAAAVTLFLNSSNSYNIQKAAEDVQDAEVFAVDNMRKEIAMANLGSFRPMTQDSPWTGMIFTTTTQDTNSAGGAGRNEGGNLRGYPSNSIANTNSAQSVGPSNIKTSSGDVLSDQLTIIYRAPFDMVNCEGNSVSKDNMIIERYYTAVDTATKGSDPDELSIALWCDAGTFILPKDADPDTVVSNQFTNLTFKRFKDDANTMVSFADFGTPASSTADGQPTIIINRVDGFKFLIGVQDATGISYMTREQYLQQTSARWTTTAPVVAIKFGIIARAANPISTATPTNFTLLGSNYQIKNQTKNYVRRVYESTVRIRNSGVAS